MQFEQALEMMYEHKLLNTAGLIKYTRTLRQEILELKHKTIDLEHEIFELKKN